MSTLHAQIAALLAEHPGAYQLHENTLSTIPGALVTYSKPEIKAALRNAGTLYVASVRDHTLFVAVPRDFYSAKV